MNDFNYYKNKRKSLRKIKILNKKKSQKVEKYSKVYRKRLKVRESTRLHFHQMLFNRCSRTNSRRIT